MRPYFNMFKYVTALITGKDPENNIREIKLDESGFIRVGSTVTVSGDIASDAVDSGNPVKIGFEARTTNPTAVANADRVDGTSDKLGRQVVWPYQVRDLIATAQASTATLAEVTLLAGAASTLHDLVEITCSNNSTVAVRISLRDNIAGGVVKTFDVPITNTITKEFTVPVPQNEAANSWTIQNAGSGDISGTDVTVSATFIKNT